MNISTPQKRLYAVLFLLIACCAMAYASGCTPRKSSGPCLTSDDCPEGELCIGTNCLGRVIRDATLPPDRPAPPDTNPPVPDKGTPDPGTPDPGQPDTIDSGPADNGTPDPGTPDRDTCRLDELRSCKHGCGNGTQRCKPGPDGRPAWATCEPKERERSCYGADEKTKGVGLCRGGTQKCENEQWGPCVGEVVPTKEICNDGQDNNCNGQTDEKSAGCECRKNATQPCGQSKGECQQGTQTCNSTGQWGKCIGATNPTTEVCDGKDNDCDGTVDNFVGAGKDCSVPGALGPCAKGKETCVRGKVSCKPNATASPEVCDGKDNDCDGKIDDGIAGVGKSCTLTKLKGECAKGTTRCVNDKISCVSNNKARTEICRDGKDNDCDGKIDEICGAKVPMAIVSSLGTATFKTNHITSITRMGTGVYEIATKDTCGKTYPFAGKVPIFITPRTPAVRTSSYVCTGNTGKYTVYTGAASATNSAFYVAMPSKRTDEAYGTVSYLCDRTTNVCGIHYANNGKATIKRVASGTYEIASALCKSANQPYFAQVYFNKTIGFATMAYVSPGKCRVYTFALNGALNNAISFSYWIPSPTAMAWASIDSRGKVTSANIFGDQTAKWTTKLNTVAGKFSSMTVSYSGHNSNSVPMITPATSAKYGATAGSASSGFITYPITLPSTRQMLPRMSIMFLQP